MDYSQHLLYSLVVDMLHGQRTNPAHEWISQHSCIA